MTWPDFVWWVDTNINHRPPIACGTNPISRWWCDLNEFYVGLCPPRFQNGWLMRRRVKRRRR